MYMPKMSGIDEPVLVSCADGVGTKLKIAFMTGKHQTVGIDLVAMCVNDLITTGATPLFFLDYISMGKFSSDVALQIVKGIAEGCRMAGCELLGGETAEMPGLYKPDEYDIAGFCCGIVDKKSIIDGNSIKPGDAAIGIQSSVCEELLTPTLIYTKTIEMLKNSVKLKGIAHITGGGIDGNIARCLPDGYAVRIDKNSWNPPEIFRTIQKNGNISEDEMFRTFNMGVGMVIYIPNKEATKALHTIEQSGHKGFEMGEVVKSNRHRRVIRC
jgi:phosphoribosylformylglycinamidine cyclo-ligase